MNIRMISVALASVWAFQAQAALIPSPITPSTPGVLGEGLDYGPSNCEPECVGEVFDPTLDPEDLVLLYKADAEDGGGVVESGAFAGSYDTVFNSDRSGATISGGPGIVCGTCYLVIKDGNHDPGYYFFDLGAAGWDGVQTITLAGFWPNDGSISHVSIWGTSVPEPGTLSLLGAGLLLAGFKNRKKLLG